jgi:hypothetical protein
MEKASSAREGRIIAESRDYTPAYDMTSFLNDFTEISGDTLELWHNQWSSAKLCAAIRRQQDQHPLDVLYNITA